MLLSSVSIVILKWCVNTEYIYDINVMEFNNINKYFQRESGKLSQGNYCICVNSFEKMSYFIIIYHIRKTILFMFRHE